MTEGAFAQFHFSKRRRWASPKPEGTRKQTSVSLHQRYFRFSLEGEDENIEFKDVVSSSFATLTG